MIKLFISQPMRDKTDDQIKEERNGAIAECYQLFGKCDVLESFFEGVPHDVTPLWFLGESIKLLGTADVVYMCKDWQYYRGCIVEHECAVRYGKQIIYA